ncbi:MAG TPA: DUF3761 domain-containing protein [Gemmatimonadales bacterium]|nr:DUF3761 domain-containing protein [Gemmatimonadales bacterium]
MRSLCRPLLAYVTTLCLSPIGVPARAAAPPPVQRNPTAHCSDGTYYYGPHNKRLACAHHRGVAEWLAPPPGAARRPRTATRGRAAHAPRGATAHCRDGSYSFARERKRACVGHRGIARWLPPR